MIARGLKKRKGKKGQEVQKWLLMGLAVFRADPEFGWAAKSND
jgi:hypothetical protein